MKTVRHELVVVGGGPAGYVAAIRAAQLGIDVACIDENPKFGGTCLRVGCIPSKALLESSHLYEESKHQFAQHGINVDGVTLSLDTMMARKKKIVDTLTGGIDMLFKKKGVTPYKGRGKLQDVESVVVTGADGEQTLVQGDKILLCPGSVPAKLSSVEEDDDRIGNSTTALSFPDVPERLVVIGGGYIGLELGSVWNRLGSEVIVLEALDRILPGMDNELAQLAHRTFAKQGLEFRTSTFVESAKRDGDKCIVAIKDGDPITCDRVLLATGRTPSTDELGLEAAGLETDRRGFISVDENSETSVQGIFAAGDCVGGMMLAHKAMEEAIVCVERMTGMKSHMNHDIIPAIVYTHPEIATVGKTEEQLKDAGIEYTKGVCPMGANGRAQTLGETTGRVKILADAKTDRVLGVHIIGVRAGDLIAETTAAMEFGASSEDIARTCHAHPTLSEAVHEGGIGGLRKGNPHDLATLRAASRHDFTLPPGENPAFMASVNAAQNLLPPGEVGRCNGRERAFANCQCKFAAHNFPSPGPESPTSPRGTKMDARKTKQTSDMKAGFAPCGRVKSCWRSPGSVDLGRISRGDPYRERGLLRYLSEMSSSVAESFLTLPNLMWVAVSLIAATLLFSSMNQRREKLTGSLRDHVDRTQGKAKAKAEDQQNGDE